MLDKKKADGEDLPARLCLLRVQFFEFVRYCLIHLTASATTLSPLEVQQESSATEVPLPRLRLPSVFHLPPF